MQKDRRRGLTLAAMCYWATDDEHIPLFTATAD